MELKYQTYSVLVVTASKTFRSSVADLLAETSCTTVHFAADISAAKRAIAERTFDFMIISAPLPDDPGIRFALDVSDQRKAVVLLLLPEDLYAESEDRAIAHGVFMLPKPVSKNTFLTGVRWISSARELLRKSEQKILSVDAKMKEIRLINRAKWLLIEKEQMSEADAHRHIEKQAMDRCVTRAVIAQEIMELHKD